MIGDGTGPNGIHVLHRTGLGGRAQRAIVDGSFATRNFVS